MSDPKLTVIIPVYNTEKYLKQCLDSVLAQSFQDMEIICIDDGSTDGSSSILTEYAGRDFRVRLIHKENGGLVSVRKLGVAEAKGKYIGFVDSDDWIDPTMYESLYQEANKYGADMVSSNYWQEGAYSNISRDAVTPGIYDDEGMVYLRDHAILDLKNHDKGLSGSLCTKIFRTSLLRKVIPQIPDEVTVSEDKLTTITFLLECKKVIVLDEAYYHYRINQNSMFHAEDTDYLLNYHRVYKYFRELYNNKNFTDNMRRQSELYVVQFLIKGINTQLGFSFRNLMWIDPEWLSTAGLGRRIALYKEGDLGRTYEKHILNSKDKVFCGYIDTNNEYDLDDFDSVVIAVKNEEIAGQAKKDLMNIGIPEDHIFFFKQEEIIWKYVDAMGLDREM